MKWHYPIVAAIVLLQWASAPAQETRTSIEVFPGKKTFPTLTADGLAHGMFLGRVTDNQEWMGNVGAALPLVEAKFSGSSLQLGAAATVFNRIIKTPGHITVYTVDYKVDFPMDLRMHSFAARVALGHVSSHLADDGIEILHMNSISYVRDYLTLAVAYDIPFLGGYVYGSGDWNFHYEPVSDPWILQFGGEGGNLSLAEWVRFYVALDIKFRQNLAWGTTQSYQAGFRFFVKDRFALRFVYTFRTGYEERGQFYDQKRTENILGLYIDL